MEVVLEELIQPVTVRSIQIALLIHQISTMPECPQRVPTANHTPPKSFQARYPKVITFGLCRLMLNILMATGGNTMRVEIQYILRLESSPARATLIKQRLQRERMFREGQGAGLATAGLGRINRTYRCTGMLQAPRCKSSEFRARTTAHLMKMT